jgi:hypothetical protein
MIHFLVTPGTPIRKQYVSQSSHHICSQTLVVRGLAEHFNINVANCYANINDILLMVSAFPSENSSYHRQNLQHTLQSQIT